MRQTPPFSCLTTPQAKMMGKKALEAARTLVDELGLHGTISPEDFLREREEALDKLFPTSQLLPGAGVCGGGWEGGQVGVTAARCRPAAGGARRGWLDKLSPTSQLLPGAGGCGRGAFRDRQLSASPPPSSCCQMRLGTQVLCDSQQRGPSASSSPPSAAAPQPASTLHVSCCIPLRTCCFRLSCSFLLPYCLPPASNLQSGCCGTCTTMGCPLRLPPPPTSATLSSKPPATASFLSSSPTSSQVGAKLRVMQWRDAEAAARATKPAGGMGYDWQIGARPAVLLLGWGYLVRMGSRNGIGLLPEL